MQAHRTHIDYLFKDGETLDAGDMVLLVVSNPMMAGMPAALGVGALTQTQASLPENHPFSVVN